MAKWRRRSKAGPSVSTAGATGSPASAETPTGSTPGLSGVNELRGELESLKAELSSAQEHATQRQGEPSGRRRRRVAVAAGAVTVGAGVTVGVLVSGQGTHRRLAAPAPVTSAPTTPAPATSAPVTSAPVTSAPVSPAPPTSVTPSSPGPATASAAPSSSPPFSSSRLLVVRSGQNFWSIAVSEETQALGRDPSDPEVAKYWLGLVAANASRLVRPGDPNLLYVGQEILLPPV